MSELGHHNFFDVRWSDGFCPVFDGPDEVRREIEAVIADSPEARESAFLTVRRRRLAGGEDLQIALVRYDTYVIAQGRFQSFLHAVALIASDLAPLTRASWEGLVKARYGDDVESRLDELNERCAALAKQDGVAELLGCAFTADDLARALADDKTAADHGDPVVERVEPPPALPSSRRRVRSGRTRRWIVAAATAVGIAAVLVVAIERSVAVERRVEQLERELHDLRRGCPACPPSCARTP